MTINELSELFMTAARVKALSAATCSAVTTAYSLAGSSASVMLAGLRRRNTPVLVIGD